METSQKTLDCRRGRPNRRGRPLLLVLAAFVGFGALGVWLSRTRAISAQSINGLVVEPRDLDIGSAWVDREFRWSLPITNTTDRDQTVDRFRVSCGCTRIDPPSLRIPAGKTEQVELTIDLTASAREPSYSAWPLSTDIVPVVKGGIPPLSPWRLTGTVKSAWYLDPQRVDFGELSGAEASLKAAVVRLLGHEAIARITAEYDNDLLEVTVTRRTLSSAPGEFEVRVAFRETPRAGRHDLYVKLSGFGPDGQRLGGFALPVAGRLFGPVRALPEQIDLGVQGVGTVVSKDVTFSAADGKPFDVVVAADEGTASTVDEVPLGYTDQRVFRVRHRASSVGNQKTELRFLVVRDAPKGAFEIIIPIVYFGVPGSDQRRADGADEAAESD